MMYPSTSNAETATWKYTYSDYDHALYGGKLFSTVGNGVIIYSMWGDEGNDEVLKKYQDLNKFIAENVNLGAITESKETVS